MDTVYATTSPTSTRLPDLFDTSLQSQRRERGKTSGRGHRPAITLPLRLLIASMIQTDRKDRPHGVITSVAELLETSRQTLYDIGARWGSEAEAKGNDAPDSRVTESPAERRRPIEDEALTLLVAGAMQLRGVEYCLERLRGEWRSHGWLSELVDEAGQRAGKVLEAADWSGAMEMIAARDELYFSDLAWLLTVDARSHAIISGHVENSADAEAWGLSLALDQVRTDNLIVGLSEDEATFYPSSISIAQKHLESPFRPPVQKDYWHILRRARQIVRDAQRIALRKMEEAEKKVSQVRPGLWVIGNLDSNWEKAHERAEQAIRRADRIWIAVELLTLVDLFERTTARTWQLRRAVVNSVRHPQRRIERAALVLHDLCQHDPHAEALADRLAALLHGTIRTSSACENVNSILRAYLWGRRAFKNRRTAQNWLNLLILYYNLHIFQRGKRAGHSHFELAGVVVHTPDGEPTQDWIEALGYAQAA